VKEVIVASLDILKSLMDRDLSDKNEWNYHIAYV